MAKLVHFSLEFKQSLTYSCCFRVNSLHNGSQHNIITVQFRVDISLLGKVLRRVNCQGTYTTILQREGGQDIWARPEPVLSLTWTFHQSGSVLGGFSYTSWVRIIFDKLIVFCNYMKTDHCYRKLFTFPTCDFIWGSSFVVSDVRNSNPKISRSYELYRRRYSTSKVSSMGLWNFRYPI